MSFLFLNGWTLKGLRITLRLLEDTFPYNPLCITVNLNFTFDKIFRFKKDWFTILYYLEISIPMLFVNTTEFRFKKTNTTEFRFKNKKTSL